MTTQANKSQHNETIHKITDFFKKRKLLALVLGCVALFGVYKVYHHFFVSVPAANKAQTEKADTGKKSTASKKDSVVTATSQYKGDASLAGPRQGVSGDTPNEKGFDVFAVSVPGVLSRSGQPTLADFAWLKKNGWKSVVDFRQDGEKNNPEALDSNIAGFNDLKLTFLNIAIKDGDVLTADQANQFLKFVTDAKNQPVHVHCAAGIGRTGIAVALYRYSVEGWPMEKAIEEAKLFKSSGVNKKQTSWLLKWAAEHSIGGYNAQ